MIQIRKIVKLEELPSYLRNLEFSKVEIKPAALKKLRDIAILCYYRVDPKDILTIKSTLKNTPQHEHLPIEIKSKIGGFVGNFSNNNLWMTLADFHDMVTIEKNYRLNFGIPKRYRVLYETLKKNHPELL